MLVICYDFRVVVEVNTAKEFVEFLRDGLDVTLEQCCIRGVYRTDIR